MTIRVGINGFGRMGRLALRAAWGLSDFTVTHVNEVQGGAATAAHLLEFDSVHGRWARDIRETEGGLLVDGVPITFSEHADPGKIPGRNWASTSSSSLRESSGRRRACSPTSTRAVGRSSSRPRSARGP